MKIVLGAHRFLPRFTGGVEVYTFNLAQTLQRMGHQVHILTSEPVTTGNLAVHITEESYQGVAVTRLGYDYQQRSAITRACYAEPSVTAEIKAVLRHLQPDIFHATSFSLLMAGSIEAAASLDVPVVHTAMDRVLICRRGFHLKADQSICEAPQEQQRCAACMGPQTPFQRGLELAWRLTPGRARHQMLPALEQATGKKADFVYAAESIRARLAYLSRWLPYLRHIIAPSSYTKAMFELNGFPPDKITVRPYGVPPAAPDFQKSVSAQTRFGFIGRVTPIKGLHLLLEAIERLQQPPESFSLIIYGDAEAGDEAYLRDLQAKSRRHANIGWAGPLDNADMGRAYRQMDMLVFPSISPENSPLTILEAQAHQTPVISSQIAGVLDIIKHEVNGLLFANGDSGALAGQMQRCLQSPTLMNTLAQNSGCLWTLEQDAGQITEIYRAVLSGN